MNEITVKAYAKINLSIDVLGKRPDGYHEVLMVMQQVDLYDLVKVTWMAASELAEELKSNAEEEDEKTKTESGIQIDLSTCLPFLPVDQRNIAYKAAELMIKQYGGEKTGCIMIELVKTIPVAAGLAGGSANCAAVLHGLNHLWELGLDVETLMKLGAGLGADVPFCIAGQAALNEKLGLDKDRMAGTCAVASGIGDKLELVNPLKAWILLSKPSICVSTAQVYGGLDLKEIEEHPNTAELVSGLREGNFHKISKNMTNLLESYSLKEYPVIMYTKNKIIQEGKAYKALMSGSGPTVFGLFTSKRKGIAAYSKLKYLNKETFLIKTL